MYESPIEIVMTDPIIEQLRSEENKYIIRVCQKVGVEVDENELIQALKYDRDQYSKGFADGMAYQSPVITNGDKIRAMPDLELAIWYCKFRDCLKCPHEKGCGVVGQGVLNWLRQEVKE